MTKHQIEGGLAVYAVYGLLIWLIIKFVKRMEKGMNEDE